MATKTSRPTENRAQRRERPSVTGGDDIIGVSNKDPNYVYRVFNDKGSRIAQKQRQGWEPVATGDVHVNTTNAVKPGEVASMVVDNQTGMEGVVMRIPKEYYEEDQKAKQDFVDERETALRNQSKKQGNYGKVSIEEDRV